MGGKLANLAIKYLEKNPEKLCTISPKALKAIGAKPKIGNKLNYIFGKSTGPAHSIKRSIELYKELQKIGIKDNPDFRRYLTEKIIEAFYSNSGFMENAGSYCKEVLLPGPNGFLKLQVIFQGMKVVTFYLKGGK